MARGSVLGKAATLLEREEHQAERAAMDQTRLPVPGLRGMGFGLQRPGQIGQVEHYGRSGQPGAGVRPKPLVCGVHVVPLGCRTS
jgi:hypothetical protein